jgi:transposase
MTSQKSSKKNLTRELSSKQFSKAELYFFDESRFGTHSKIGHGWFKRGKRTEIKVKLGFQNFYLYSAVNPKTGDSFSLTLPKVNTICMNIFLKEMAERLKGAPTIIVMDGAGWHKSKDLKIPDNISIIYLPPYSPELNPVERLWLHIKQRTIKNKIYHCLDDLENAVGSFVKNISAQTLASICSIDYSHN